MILTIKVGRVDIIPPLRRVRLEEAIKRGWHDTTGFDPDLLTFEWVEEPPDGGPH